MNPGPSSVLLPAGIAVLVGWRMVSRIRRMVGRQRLSKVRPWITVCIFPLLLASLLAGSIGHPMGVASLAAGAASGVALGLLGLRLTRFEETPLGLFYTPNAHLGIALSLVLVVRIGYRFARAYFGSGEISPPTTASMLASPLTLAIFGTLAGYYVAYAVGLLRWRRRVRRNGPDGSQTLSPPPERT